MDGRLCCILYSACSSSVFDDRARGLGGRRGVG
jgi:hypothetical protein